MERTRYQLEADLERCGAELSAAQTRIGELEAELASERAMASARTTGLAFVGTTPPGAIDDFARAARNIAAATARSFESVARDLAAVRDITITASDPPSRWSLLEID